VQQLLLQHMEHTRSVVVNMGVEVMVNMGAVVMVPLWVMEVAMESMAASSRTMVSSRGVSMESTERGVSSRSGSNLNNLGCLKKGKTY